MSSSIGDHSVRIYMRGRKGCCHRRSRKSFLEEGVELNEPET